MHRNHGGGHGHGRHYGNIYANNVNITNVTNVTNVTQIRAEGSWKQKGRKPRRERPPKLARFSHSCGLLDTDRALSMDEAEFGCEMGKVLAYDAKGAWNAVEGMGRGVCGIAKSIGQGIGSIFDAIGQVIDSFQ